MRVLEAGNWATKEDALADLKKLTDAVVVKHAPFYQGNQEVVDLQNSDIWARVALAMDVPITVLGWLHASCGVNFLRAAMGFLSTCDLPEAKDYPARVRTDPGPCYPPE